jgi:hypothetical protein
MGERAIAAAFEANEIKKIITDELAKRLDGLSPLTGGKEYSHFTASFRVDMTLFRAGEPGLGRKTMAWGTSQSLGKFPLHPPTAEAVVDDTYESKEPNVERVAREMPVTVESGDGKGGKRTRKVVIKG